VIDEAAILSTSAALCRHAEEPMVWSPLWPSVGAAARDAADEAHNAIGHVDNATQITDQAEFDPGLAIKFTIYPARAISPICCLLRRQIRLCPHRANVDRQ